MRVLLLAGVFAVSAVLARTNQFCRLVAVSASVQPSFPMRLSNRLRESVSKKKPRLPFSTAGVRLNVRLYRCVETQVLGTGVKST